MTFLYGTVEIGKLKVVRGGFGNYRSFKLTNIKDEDLIHFTYDLIKDTLGRQWEKPFCSVTIPSLKLAGQFFPDQNNGKEESSEIVISEKLITAEGKLNAEACKLYVDKNGMNLNAAVKSFNDSIIALTKLKAEIIGNKWKSVDVLENGSITQSQEVIGSWEEDVRKSNGNFESAVIIIKNNNGGILAWSYRERMFVTVIVTYVIDGQLKKKEYTQGGIYYNYSDEDGIKSHIGSLVGELILKKRL